MDEYEAEIEIEAGSEVEAEAVENLGYTAHTGIPGIATSLHLEIQNS